MKYFCDVKLLKLVPIIIYFFYLQKKKISKGLPIKSLNLKIKYRSSTILPLFNHINFLVYNGKSFINVFVTKSKFFYKFGSFSFSKIPARHNKKKKK